MRGPPKLYRLMYTRKVFTTEEAAKTSHQSKTRTERQLSYLTKHGYLDRVRRGLYVLRPLQKEESAANAYLVASKLVDPYALCFHTALELHGVAHSTFS